MASMKQRYYTVTNRTGWCRSIALVVTSAVLVVIAGCGTDEDTSTTEPAATEDVTSPPPNTEPAATQPAQTRPPATQPPATEPTATEPAATDPPAAEPEMPTAPAALPEGVEAFRCPRTETHLRDAGLLDTSRGFPLCTWVPVIGLVTAALEVADSKYRSLQISCFTAEFAPAIQDEYRPLNRATVEVNILGEYRIDFWDEIGDELGDCDLTATPQTDFGPSGTAAPQEDEYFLRQAAAALVNDFYDNDNVVIVPDITAMRTITQDEYFADCNPDEYPGNELVIGPTGTLVFCDSGGYWVDAGG